MNACSCILVAEASRFGQAAFDGLIENGIAVDAIWSEAAEKFTVKSELLRPVRSLRSREWQSFARRVRYQGTKVSSIVSPSTENLSAELKQHTGIDFILVAGSGIILPRAFLEECNIPVINIHPTLLPAYRGPSPIHALVLNDDADTFGGITAHLVAAKIDAGAIIKQNKVRLCEYKTVRAWETAIHEKCHDLIADGIVPYLRGEIEPVEQDESHASYFSMAQVPSLISPSMSFAQAENFSKKARALYANTKLNFLDANSKHKTLRIMGGPTLLGKPTSQAAKITYRTIELDLADARVRFQINNRLRRLSQKLRRLAAF